MNELLRQLQDARSQRVREQMKVSELSQQLTTLLQENSALEEQLTVWRNKAQDVKNLQDEISTLEEVRYARCLSFPASVCFLSVLDRVARVDQREKEPRASSSSSRQTSFAVKRRSPQIRRRNSARKSVGNRDGTLFADGASCAGVACAAWTRGRTTNSRSCWTKRSTTTSAWPSR